MISPGNTQSLQEVPVEGVQYGDPHLGHQVTLDHLSQGGVQPLSLLVEDQGVGIAVGGMIRIDSTYIVIKEGVLKYCLE